MRGKIVLAGLILGLSGMVGQRSNRSTFRHQAISIARAWSRANPFPGTPS